MTEFPSRKGARLWLAVACAAVVTTAASGTANGGFEARGSDLGAQAASGQEADSRALGTVRSISGNVITLTTEQGSELSVTVREGARLLRVEPGAKDLKNAAPLTLQEIVPGDRILVRGKLSGDGKAMEAASVIAMKKEDIAAKQAREREAWQRNSVGGLVSSVDPSANTVTINTSAVGTNKAVTIHVWQNTILRRYAPGSVKFDEAKAAPLSEIKAGDQLRARGTRSADGSELHAEEIVSGTFRNIAGTISSIDAAAGTLTVADLATKRPVVVKVTSESQMRKLPPETAQRIAARLRAARTQAGEQNQETSTDTQKAGARPSPSGSEAGGTAGGGAGSRGSGDLQQAISRMPQATLGELQKGDAVMIVAAPTAEGATAITLLAGVEPILEASPEGQSILSPWSLSGAPSGEGP